MKRSLIFLLGLILAEAVQSSRFVCYYGSWSVYRYGNAKFTVEDIDPKLCTHLIFSFVGINEDGSVRILDSWNDVGDEWKEGALTKMQKLKTINPNLKLLIAIGGWNQGSEIFSKVVADAGKRANLIQSATDLVLSNNFDGFDLDWEYPTQRGGVSADRDNFSQLLREFRGVFDSKGLLLSAAVHCGPSTVDIAYDVPQLSQNLDFINVMTYDIHGAWDPVTGHNAPLFAGPNDKALYGNNINVADSIKHWIANGADPQKINVGLATYGRSFTLTSQQSTSVGAPIRDNGVAGKFVQEAGFLAYNEICFEVSQSLWAISRDDVSKVPYAVKGDQWVGYDDPQSIIDKINFAKSLNLGGAMVWSIETDDFNNICGLGRYPLITAAVNALGISSSPPPTAPTTAAPTTAAPTTSHPTTAAPSTANPTVSIPSTTEVISNPDPTTQPPPSTTQSSGSSIVCTSSGKYIRDPKDCNKFYVCQADLSAIKLSCQAGLVFDTSAQTCNYPSNVNC